MKKIIGLTIVFMFLFSGFVFSESNIEGSNFRPHCTNMAVGKNASVDGSAMVSQNFDTTCGDPRVWLIPAKDYPEGATRDIVVGSDMFVDYTGLIDKNHPVATDYYPEETCYGVGGVNQAHKIAEIPQVSHTYAYFWGGSASINEKGVALALSTHNPTWYVNVTEEGKEVARVMIEESPGIIDIYTAQKIALERASTAREAVNIIGDLLNEYQWYGKTWGGESMPITDGNEVWIMEIYGRDIWVAKKLPDDHFYISANAARIRDIDLEDKENVIASPNLVSFAVEQGWYDPNSGKTFSPAEIYSPRFAANRREWRALDLVAPSLNLDSKDTWQPWSVKPDNKLSVKDIFEIQGDNLEGTKYDLTKGPCAGQWGDPLRDCPEKNIDPVYGRSVNARSTTNHWVSQVKGWYPDEIKGIVWMGWGATDTSYHTPLWASMEKIPEFYYQGIKGQEPYSSDSGWWTSLRVQQFAGLRYSEAIKDIQEFRDPKLDGLYKMAQRIQGEAYMDILYGEDKESAMNLIQQFAYNNAIAMHEEWKDLGDILFGKYAMGLNDFKKDGFAVYD